MSTALTVIAIWFALSFLIAVPLGGAIDLPDEGDA